MFLNYSQKVKKKGKGDDLWGNIVYYASLVILVWFSKELGKVDGHNLKRERSSFISRAIGSIAGKPTP